MVSGFGVRQCWRLWRCYKVWRLLQDLLDGEPDPRVASYVMNHLEECRRCGLEAAIYRRIKESLARQRTPVPVETCDRLWVFLAEVDCDEPHRDDWRY